jgi:spore coat protein U-like protein
LGSEAVVIETGCTEVETVMVSGWVALNFGEDESSTLAVKFEEPAVVGVPEITPVAPRLRPVGKVPELTLHVYGGTPPVAANVDEYEEPLVASGTEEVVTETGATEAAIVKVSALLALAFGEEESSTVTVNAAEPTATGTPESLPALVKLKPAGRVPDETLQVYGAVPPEAAKVAEYEVLTIPLGSVAVVTLGGFGEIFMTKDCEML